MEELTCSRCGEKITIEEYTQNSVEYKILNIKVILHFCDKCICIVGDEKQCLI